MHSAQLSRSESDRPPRHPNAPHWTSCRWSSSVLSRCRTVAWAAASGVTYGFLDGDVLLDGGLGMGAGCVMYPDGTGLPLQAARVAYGVDQEAVVGGRRECGRTTTAPPTRSPQPPATPTCRSGGSVATARPFSWRSPIARAGDVTVTSLTTIRDPMNYGPGAHSLTLPPPDPARAAHPPDPIHLLQPALSPSDGPPTPSPPSGWATPHHPPRRIQPSNHRIYIVEIRT